MTPNEQFDAKTTAIRKMQRTDVARCIVLAEPEVLFGWNSNPHWPGLDLAQYDRKDYPHPREQDYYSAESERIKQLVEGLSISGDTDPIEVFVDMDMHEIIVLDGASRCAAISIIRQSDPDAFKRIRMQVFRGSRQEAIARMVAANMGDRRSELTLMQISRTTRKWYKSGWTLEEICQRLGKPESWKGELSRIIKLSDACPEMIAQIETGELCKTKALDMADLPPGVQKDALTSGKKLTKASIRRAKRSQAERLGKSLPGPRMKPSTKIENHLRWLGEEFVDWMGSEQCELDRDKVESLRGAAFQALNALLEEVA